MPFAAILKICTIAIKSGTVEKYINKKAVTVADELTNELEKFFNITNTF